MTIEQALALGRRLLQPVSDAPELDAQRLLLHVLKVDDSSWLITHGHEELSPARAEAFSALVEERASGKPLAYILGEWEFYGRPFLVTEDVLVPRPATEELVAQALEIIQTMQDKLQRPLIIADIGTGSGCIAVTLLLELGNNFTFFATDVSAAALEVAKQNAERYGVLDHIEFLEGDMLQPLQDREIDLIVSNPPYVPAEELRQLAEAKAGRAIETRGLRFEPQIALDGGEDGQTFIEQLKNAGVPAVLETTGGGIILVEY